MKSIMTKIKKEGLKVHNDLNSNIKWGAQSPQRKQTLYNGGGNLAVRIHITCQMRGELYVQNANNGELTTQEQQCVLNNANVTHNMYRGGDTKFAITPKLDLRGGIFSS